MQTITDERAAKVISGFGFPKYSEIPNVGLFLEQVVEYVCEYVKPLEGISVTTSMISNYVKRGLIDSPVRKQYSREQIAYIFFIAIAKSVLSLEEIEILINVRKKNYDCQYLYEYFCAEFENILKYVFGINPDYQETPIELNRNRYLLRNTIITAAHKIYLDTIFAFRSKEDTGE